jgi:hypothetical protein
MVEVIRVAGMAQLALALGSLAIPVVLGWRAETARLRPLTREVFWTYAGYIWTSHVAFGMLSAGWPQLLCDGSPLARMVCGFVAAWWGVRLALQFTVMDRSARPPGRRYVVAEAALVTLFAGLAAVYGAAVLS